MVIVQGSSCPQLPMLRDGVGQRPAEEASASWASFFHPRQADTLIVDGQSVGTEAALAVRTINSSRSRQLR